MMKEDNVSAPSSKKRWFKWRWPLPLDLVSDEVASRLLTALIAFFLFVFSAFLIVGGGNAVYYLSFVLTLIDISRAFEGHVREKACNKHASWSSC